MSKKLHQKRSQNQSKKFLKENKSSLVVILLGILVFSFGIFNYYRVRILSFNSVPKSSIQINQNDLPVEVIIPSIQIDLKVDPAEIKNGVWQISQNNATFLLNSSAPKGDGNTVIYGHNKKSIFGNLPYLSIGQKISVKTNDGSIYNYEVTEKYFVSPDRVDLVSQSNKKELTLYTCWGIFDQQRAVVKARPI